MATTTTTAGTGGEDLVVIVRAPNQEILDFRVECFSSWTVRNLKEHLQKTYQGNPLPVDQKLIYSGQLLEDSAVLRDVLRHEGASPCQHTVHLVCRPPKGSIQNSQRGQSSSTGRPTGSNTTTTPGSSTQTVPPNELRCRIPTLQINPTAFNSAAYSAHLMAMQNMYAQYYQMLLAQQQAHLNGTPTPTTTRYVFHYNTLQPQQQNAPFHQNQTPINQQNFLNNLQNNNEIVVNNNQNNNNANNNQNNNNNNLDEDGENNRDWLENIFILTRVGVFAMFIFFYSTAERFLLVSGLVGLFYLYQQGRLAIHPEVQAAAQAADLPPAAPQVNPPDDGQNNREDIERLQAAMDGGEVPRGGAAQETPVGPPSPTGAPEPPQNPVTAMANLLKAFVVSLIPDHQNL